MADPDFLASEEQFDKFIKGFENGALPRLAWTHSAHLAVASWYLISFPENEAIQRVRAGIRHYNECAGIENTPDSGYHETLTMFWLGILGEFLKASSNGGNKLDLIRSAVREFRPQRDLYRKYYSFDVVASREARANWVLPDGVDAFRGNKSTLRYI